MQLHRPDVVRGALELLEQHGLEGVTMRRLAAALGVQPGALYWHFKSKRLLLDAMADAMLAGVADPIVRGGWGEQLTELSERYRAALLAHRDGARLASGTFVAQANTLATGRAFITALTGAGVSAEDAGWVWSTIKYYILGHCIEEQSRGLLEQTGEWADTSRDAAEAESRLDPATATALRTLVAGDPADQFRNGLSMLLSGVERLIEPAPRRARRRAGASMR